MRRRELMLLLGGALTAARALRAQHKAMPVIGFLGTTSPDPNAPFGFALVSPPPRCAAHYQHAIWLYLRFTLSYRDVEELIHHLWSTSASSRLGRCTVTFNVWKDRGEEQAASFSRQAARLAARSGAAQEPGW
jgi:hypothetical protein